MLEQVNGISLEDPGRQPDLSQIVLRDPATQRDAGNLFPGHQIGLRELWQG